AGFGVEGLHLLRGGDEAFEDGSLAVAVDVGFGVGDGVGEAFAEAGVGEFVAAACSGNDDTVERGEGGDERGAGGAAVDENERTGDGGEPGGEVFGGEIGAAEIEAGFAAIEGAVAEIDDPEGRVG